MSIWRAVVALKFAVASSVIPTSLTSLGGEEYSGVSRGDPAVDIIGRVREGYTPALGRSRRTTGMGSASRADDYYCPPTLYTYGRYSITAPNCRGELGGTEFTPWLEEAEAEEDSDGSDPSPPIAVTREDVQSLLVDAGGLEVQPDRPWVLVHVETVAYTGAQQQVLSTTVLDAPIEVRVVPTLFIWDFGDGSDPLVTTDPGAPWPDHTVAHSYSAAQEGVVVGLRTEWDAMFRIPGVSPWLPVAGTVVTTETSDPFDVVTATPRLRTGNG